MAIDRRGFLAGMLALGAAPAIVRAGSLMPINQSRWTIGETLIIPGDAIYTFDTIWDQFTGVLARRNGVPMRVTKVTDWTFEIG